MATQTSSRALTLCSQKPFRAREFAKMVNSRMEFRSGLSNGSLSSSSGSSSPNREEQSRRERGVDDAVIGLQEWQAWGTSSAIPAMVMEVVENLKGLEEDMNAQMSFGGLGGKLKGNFKVQEDKKHRATYKALVDSEEKLQFFSARQIACRLLGSRGYLCQKCWLAREDCMCSKIVPSALWHGIRFWLYMHPKDFLRQNNTGKVLWQIFGVQAATLCLYGIHEHEQIMWDAFKLAGKSKVWCLYPNKTAPSKTVTDIVCESTGGLDLDQPTTNGERPLHFILLDGTWNNSAAMFRRLKEQAKSVWREEGLPCISLAMLGASPMHRLRPQPSWDRTCTAAATAGLLAELHQLPEFSSFGLEEQAEAVEDGLETLLHALTARRLRMGRSITRKERHTSNIC